MIDPSHLSEIKTWPLILRVCRLLRESNLTGYVVGGWVRDNLLGREADDIDFAVDGDGLDAAAHVAGDLNGKCVTLDKVNRVARVVMPEAVTRDTPRCTLDFATLQGTLEQDLTRRDFTINAIALDLREDGQVKVVDPGGGLQDLKNRLVRATGDGVFAADPVRLVRAVRLAATLDLSVDPGTEAILRRDAHLISRVAGERTREELLLLFAEPGSGGCLAYLQELGLLTAVFPELAVTRGVVQPNEHYWDVLDHSIRTVEALDYVLRRGTWQYAGETALEETPWPPDVETYFECELAHGSTRRTLLKLSALLHDIAKPQTMSVEESGKVRFLGHGQEGAAIAVAILERLRFGTREKRFVETAVKYHLRPTQMGWPELPTRRAIYRYFRDTGEAGVGILFLSLADHLATRGPAFHLSNWQIHTRTIRHILSQKQDEPQRESRLIDGHDIMSAFRLNPGRQVGELLEMVHEAQAAGEVATREEALEMVRSVLSQKPTSQAQEID
jgi:poly(A) polymerase